MRQSAEELYISQPSLSIAIKNLEEELGIDLFDRTGHRLRLTYAGKEFLIHCQKILEETDNSILHMKRLSEEHRKKISIGCIAPVLGRYLPRCMNAFRSLPGNSDVVFEITEGSTAELIEKLQNGLLDFLLCTETTDQSLDQHRLMETPLVLIRPLAEMANHAGDYTWKEIEALPLVGYPIGSAMTSILDEIWDKEKILPELRYRMPTEEAILSMVESGFGYAIIPQTPSLQDFRVGVCPLPSGGYFQRISLAALSGQKLSGAAGEFTEYLKTGPLR